MTFLTRRSPGSASRSPNSLKPSAAESSPARRFCTRSGVSIKVWCLPQRASASAESVCTHTTVPPAARIARAIRLMFGTIPRDSGTSAGNPAAQK